MKAQTEQPFSAARFSFFYFFGAVLVRQPLFFYCLCFLCRTYNKLRRAEIFTAVTLCKPVFTLRKCRTEHLCYINCFCNTFNIFQRKCNIIHAAGLLKLLPLAVTLHLSIHRVNELDVLTCVNSCKNAPVAIGKVLKSTKIFSEFHGFGINSVKRIVSKYNGSFDWDFNNETKEFTSYITFCNQKAEPVLQN